MPASRSALPKIFMGYLSMMLGVRQHRRPRGAARYRCHKNLFAPVSCRSSNEMPRSSDDPMETVDAENQEFRWTVLMEQSLEGDCAAYGELLSSVTAALRRAIRARARQVGLDAEDVVQEVLLALHLKRNTWVRGTPVAPWVAAIARNKIVDAHRRRGRRPETPIESVIETLRNDSAASDEQSHDLERSLAKLPPRQREVLLAVSLAGYSAQETALRLRMSEVGVRVTLHRALKSLSALFSRETS